MKGANWIPCDAYESRQTPQRYRDLLESAKAANMNMIRLWGGGQYEKDVFYDLCDELGIMVWHDMMCSCAVYPGNDEFLGEISAELAHQLRRLRDHASIAMWCGDNECLGAVNWFKETRKDPDFYRGEWMKRSKMQGELVKKYDPARTYWPSSPCCGPGDFGDAWKEDSKGDMHNWDVWHENKPFAKYYEYHPRFCSEFGFQSFPSMEIAETFASKEQILSRGPDFEWHQKNGGGNERIRKTLERYFPEPKDVPSELLLSQFQQAMAIQMAVDAWRSEQPRCMGTLFWQLNDNWPVASWSSIEYGGKWKPLQYLAKRFFEPVHVTLAPDGTVKVINDTDKTYVGSVRAVFFPFDGGKMEIVDIGLLRSPPGSAVAAGSIAQRTDAALELLFLYSLEDSQMGFVADNFPVRADYKGELPKANVKAEIDGFKVTLTTDKPAFWVWMNAKGFRGEFDDNAVTLVPGVKRVFAFKPADKATTPEAFRAAFSVTHLTEICK
jgi:beta-mannosidase